MAVIIGDAHDLGYWLMNSSRAIVRTSGGGIYIVAIDRIASPAAIAVWYSADGSSWAEKDAANRPEALDANLNGYCVAIDSNNLLHIFYYDYKLQFSYTTFDTSTDQWNGGSAANVEQVAGVIEGVSLGDSLVAITIDSNNKPHVAWFDGKNVHGTAYDTVWYSNKVGVSWKAALEVEGQAIERQCHYLHITVNAGDIPLIVFLNDTDDDITAAKGNQNDATAFTLKDVDETTRSGNDNSPSIAVDSDGNAWIAYVDVDNTIDIAKQSANWTDAWTITSDGDIGEKPSIVIIGTDIYVFYKDLNEDIFYNKYSSGSWSGKIQLHVDSFWDVKGRWAYNNNYPYASVGIDYVFADYDDLYWATLSIAAPPAYIPKVIMVQ